MLHHIGRARSRHWSGANSTVELYCELYYELYYELHLSST